MNTVDELTMKRLAFIAYLFQLATAQSVQPAPLSSSAVLSLHDAVELFLVLAADHRGISLTKNVTFEGYWKEIENAPSTGVALTMASPMRRLNQQRVNLKHHGTSPSPDSLDQARSDVRAFFDNNTPTVFGIEFDQIELAHVVPQAKVREWLLVSSELIRQGSRGGRGSCIPRVAAFILPGARADGGNATPVDRRSCRSQDSYQR